MSNPTRWQDVQTRLGRPLSTTEQATVGALLVDAWANLGTYVGGLSDRLASGSLDEDLVIGVVSAMVLRVVRNPEGKSQERIDDYSYIRSTKVADGELEPTAAEVKRLSPGVRTSSFSIAPGY